jgi:hypothetical protein
MQRTAFQTVTVLIAILIAAIIAVNLISSEPSGSAASPVVIPDVAVLSANETVGVGAGGLPSMPTLTGPSALQARISSEPRDPSWSPQAERALDAYFNGDGKTGSNKAKAYCSGSTCIVTGKISASDKPAELRSSMQAVQDKASNAVSSWMGFASGPTVSFSPSSDRDGMIRYTTYVLRSDKQ